MMELGLKGKRALVMGASRGLGRAIAASLATEGCDLILSARNTERLGMDAAALQSAHGIAVTAIGLDLANATSVQSLIDTIKTLGGIDILVANVGGPPPSGALGVAPDIWQKHFESMVLSLIRIIDGLIPAMREKKWGRILTITSSGVVQPIPTLAMSNTLRAALVTFSKTLATEVAADGITVNVVLPGRIATERVAELDHAAAARAGTSVEDARAKSTALIPMKRYGTVTEFASVCTFLVSAPAAYMTGGMVRIDGGLIQSI
ncbi:MAG: SDR family oxidoreductase [Rhodospirillaceae bacterium]|nr:SDR family oxidoreductase [Rhodospirillaceae bacterium]